MKSYIIFAFFSDFVISKSIVPIFCLFHWRKCLTPLRRDITWFSPQWKWIFLNPHTAFEKVYWTSIINFSDQLQKESIVRGDGGGGGEWRDQTHLSAWELRMQCKNSDQFNEEIILLYLSHFCVSKIGWDCYIHVLTGYPAWYFWRYPEISPLTGCFVSTYQKIITISDNCTRKLLFNRIIFSTYSHRFSFHGLQFWPNNCNKHSLLSNLRGRASREV